MYTVMPPTAKVTIRPLKRPFNRYSSPELNSDACDVDDIENLTLLALLDMIDMITAKS